MNFFSACYLAMSTIAVPAANGQVAAGVRAIFPQGTVAYGNVPYASDTLKQHLLDIYLPAGARANTPLVVWVHGGGWMSNDKYADMGYMKNTIRSSLDKGYALASIDYRFSTDAAFPAQIQDCNQAMEYLYQHAEKYKLDKERIALMGFSAGGHLASLMALSNNNPVTSFSTGGKKVSFRIKAVVDFYGPSDFLAMTQSDAPQWNAQEGNAVTRLLGASPLQRPDIARLASPVSYVDKNDPPFLIIHGEKDQSVSTTQSLLLSSWLKLSGIPNQVMIIPGAPHYGEMFDAEDIKKSVLQFLATHL